MHHIGVHPTFLSGHFMILMRVWRVVATTLFISTMLFVVVDSALDLSAE